MDSFEINKFVAAILMVALLIIGISKVSDIVFYVEKPKTQGYAVEVEAISNSSSSTTETVEKKTDINALMALGSAADGEKIFKKCAACHSISKGGKNKIIKCKPIIIVEIWNNNKRNLERMQTTNDEIINYIINLGYKLVKQLGDNYIFLPKDKT